MEADTRVGGRWKITDRRQGVDYMAIGEYLEIEPPHLLVFSFGMPQFSEEFTRVTVETKSVSESACVPTLTHEPLSAEVVAGLKKGWTEMFDGLSQHLKSSNSISTTIAR
jgi:uncharacterized protein YndB with AHSA1/START domain